MGLWVIRYGRQRSSISNIFQVFNKIIVFLFNVIFFFWLKTLVISAQSFRYFLRVVRYTNVPRRLSDYAQEVSRWAFGIKKKRTANQHSNSRSIVGCLFARELSKFGCFHWGTLSQCWCHSHKIVTLEGMNLLSVNTLRTPIANRISRMGLFLTYDIMSILT